MIGSDYWTERSRAIEPLFFRAPHPPTETPRPYQFSGVEYALARDHCLIGDAPGVGKTAQAIMISNAINARKTLWICPASLRHNAEEEIWRWSTIPNVSTYPVAKARDGVSDFAHYVIISYDLLRNPAILAALLAQRWDHVVLDEAHALKDPKGNKRTRVICAPDMLPRVAGRFTLLSGTILPNTPRECLGADTLVLTNGGWKALITVSTNDLLWDGVEWVPHSGVICQGTKPTLNVAGVSVTAEHNLNVNGSWHAAADLASHETLLVQALATGSASLPSWALPSAQKAASWACLFNATAAASRSRHISLMRATDAQPAVGHAARKQAKSPTLSLRHTEHYAPMPPFGNAFSAFAPISRNDATTPISSATKTTGAAASLSTSRGDDPAWSSCGISLLSPATTILRSNLTEPTMTEATSRATSSSSLAQSTWEIDERSPAWNSKSPNCKPVYDIMNAGPRRRFTILSDRGPLIVHNCYNACRLLDWDCIDQMSLEDFNNYYYGEGGGTVRTPVWDEQLKARVSKVHWSDTVRNVPQNLDELQRRLRSRIMVRRLKAQVLPQLPPKQFHLAPLAITQEMKLALKHPGWSRVGQLIDMDPEDFAAGVGVDGEISTARRVLGEAKIGPTCDYIDELLHEGIDKIVVAAHHTSVLAVARARLEKYGLVFMDGATNPNKRQQIVHQFQNDPEIRVILGQNQVLGEGHTLTVAQDIVACEPDFVPGRIEQLVDRIHRIGQTGSYVQAHLPIVPGTLDERVISIAIDKAKAIHLALDAV